MAMICGKVVFEDLSGGVWRFQGEDGELYDLMGGDAGLHKDGQRAEIKGTVQNQMAGIGMGGGPILEVKSYRLV